MKSVVLNNLDNLCTSNTDSESFRECFHSFSWILKMIVIVIVIATIRVITHDNQNPKPVNRNGRVARAHLGRLRSRLERRFAYRRIGRKQRKRHQNK